MSDSPNVSGGGPLRVLVGAGAWSPRMGESPQSRRHWFGLWRPHPRSPLLPLALPPTLLPPSPGPPRLLGWVHSSASLRSPSKAPRAHLPSWIAPQPCSSFLITVTVSDYLLSVECLPSGVSPHKLSDRVTSLFVQHVYTQPLAQCKYSVDVY